MKSQYKIVSRFYETSVAGLRGRGEEGKRGRGEEEKRRSGERVNRRAGEAGLFYEPFIRFIDQLALL